VKCSDCESQCSVVIERNELEEDCITEGFQHTCPCGCTFTFDVHVDVMNKVTV